MNKAIVLKRTHKDRFISGHPWVFSNEVSVILGEPNLGDIVELQDENGCFLGKGFFNPHSLIMFRLLSLKNEDINLEFWKGRIKKAYEYRKNVFPGENSFRMVFGESDFLPGLIVDKYNEYLVVQFLSAGMDKNHSEIVDALKSELVPLGILARNDSALRKQEGLDENVTVLFGEIPEKVKIEENGHIFSVNLSTGQKTGFFFDQRENRFAITKYCKDKVILDCYCNLGGFSIYALKAGAKKAVCVDTSKTALDSAKENAVFNDVSEKTEIVKADAEEYLIQIKKTGKKFDIIIIDPPAFIKSKKHFYQGYKAYVRVNALALSALNESGILATSSCSHNLSLADFKKMMLESATKARKQVRLLELRGQSRDHPVLLSIPETEYLKFALLEAVK